MRANLAMVARRLFLLVSPFALSACGLILGFDGYSDHYDDPPDPGLVPDGGKDKPDAKDSAATTDAPRPTNTDCPLPADPSAIGCERATVFALAATDSAVLWLTGARGAVLHTLASGVESVIQPAPPSPIGGSAVARDAKLRWGFRLQAESSVQACDAPACTPAPIGPTVTNLRWLSMSGAGLYALTGDGASSRILAIDAVTPFDFTPPPETNGISHFAVNEKFAYWRLDDKNKQSCELASCVPSEAKRTGNAPYLGLGQDRFVSVGNDQNIPRVIICPSTPGISDCEDSALLDFSKDAFDPDRNTFLNLSAVALSSKEEIYVGGQDANDPTKVKIRKAPSAKTDLSAPLLAELPGTAVTALAVNGTQLFYAVKNGDQTIIHVQPL